MDYRFEVTAYPLLSAMGGDLVIFKHVAPVGWKVAEVASVAGPLRMLPPLVLLQVGLEARLVRAEAAGQGSDPKGEKTAWKTAWESAWDSILILWHV